MQRNILLFILLISFYNLFAKKDTLIKLIHTQSGKPIELRFIAGRTHNHPLYAIWIEDEKGKYIQTLYVSESIGKGFFSHGDSTAGKWLPGEIQRPAALPHWAHQRGVKNEYDTYLPSPRQPIADAYTGATPAANFTLESKTDQILDKPFKIKMEINQSWDWNSYWHNNLYPDDAEYKTSCQPALIYEVLIDPQQTKKEYLLKLIGHSHYSGKDGSINPNLSTLSTAKKIAKKIIVKLP